MANDDVYKGSQSVLFVRTLATVVALMPLLIFESYIDPVLNRITIVFWEATNLQGKLLGRPKSPKRHAPAGKLYSLRRYDGSRLGCMPFFWVATNELPRSKSVNNRTCSKRLFYELPIWLWFKNKKTQIKML